MPLTRKVVPKDSILHLWLTALGIMEVPVSYQILCGLSGIGASLRRNIYIDQVRTKVYPNLSVLLIGPSGIGKDTIIDQTTELVEAIGTTQVIGAGKTMESVKTQLLHAGIPACCYTPAGELTAFIGQKDFQKGMVPELTDLLSTGRRVDVSTKTEGVLFIHEPTVTINAGSTVGWLRDQMPKGTEKGGFLPRFVVTVEDFSGKFVPWVKYSNQPAEVVAAKQAMIDFFAAAREIVRRWSGPKAHEVTPLQDAEDMYTNWYINRFKTFSPHVMAYANRSRDQALRLAMLMAVTRGHGYLEVEDVQFGADVMSHVAGKIDGVIK